MLSDIGDDDDPDDMPNVQEEASLPQNVICLSVIFFFNFLKYGYFFLGQIIL